MTVINQTVSGGTTNGDILPAATGQNLGSPTQRWNAYLENTDIAGSLSLTNAITSPEVNSVLYVDNTMSSSAIQTVINTAVLTGATVYFRQGVYSLTYTTQLTGTGGFTFYTVFTMASNMHIDADPGTVLQLAAGQSTDAAPKDIAMFGAVASLSNVSIRNCTIDMNYPNNKISPNRGVSYNSYNFAHFRASGDNVTVTDALIENNSFINTPGASCIILGQSNLAGSALGARITIAHNTFLNNGMDTGDFSAIYGWANYLDIHDNQFSQSSLAPIESPFTGTFMAFEIHGANSSFHDNFVNGYGGGGYVANNFTSIVYNADIHDNQFYVTGQGIKFFNAGANSQGISGVKIHDNNFTFVESSGSPAAQFGIDMSPTLVVSDVAITNNHFIKSGSNTIPVVAFRMVPQTGVNFTDISFNHNTVIGLAYGFDAESSGGGGYGYIEAKGNTFKNLTQVSASGGPGIFVNATNTVANLVIDNNSFINDSATSFTYGIFLTSGTITRLSIGKQAFSGMATANYAEAGGITITNRSGVDFYGPARFNNGQTLTGYSDIGSTSIWSISATGKATFNAGIDANSAGFTNAGAISGATTVQTTGLLTKYNNINTAGNGVASVYAVTSQKAETGADTNVLTFTPPAAAGTYRVTFALSLSAANTATLGWTATWKDSNGNAQSPTNLSLFQEGTAAPALTFTTSSTGNYYASMVIDIDNSATNIVVKITFTGTSYAGKATATIERLV